MTPPTMSRQSRSPSAPAPPSPPPVAGVARRYGQIIKSPADQREYRGLELKNRLKVLLVSDPSTDKAAAAMNVNVGHMSDPIELPGLAHFCEHMLFRGTKKYPENKYRNFLSEHGGISNANTLYDHTYYFFDVLPAHLSQALDIFAQFFISPLFTESATEREVTAVNLEHETNLSLDKARLYQLESSTALHNHDFRKFGTGNKDTLYTIPKEKGIDVRKELLKFYKKWYSANIMTLVVVGKESLDELESMVVPLFAPIVDSAVTAPTWPEHPFPAHLRRKRIYCLPVEDTRQLNISFPIPDIRKHYRTLPDIYLMHLLRHEGPGSLHSALKARGWCNSLIAIPKIFARGFGLFVVQVDLTEDGIQHIDDIIGLVFQYIKMLRVSGAQEWVWEEMRKLMALEYRFMGRQEPLQFVEFLKEPCSWEHPIEDILTAYRLLTEWKPELIDQLLSLLTPDNVRVSIMAKHFSDKCTETEPWYGTKYLEEDISEETIETWKTVTPIQELHLPPPNEFIPSRLTVESISDSTADAIAPIIIKDTPLMRLWYKQDKEFMMPKAFMTFNLVSPLAYQDPLSYNLTSVWAMLLRDVLQQFVYAANLAGLSWSLNENEYWLNLSIDGFDDKQHVLLEKIIEHIVEFKTDPARFEIMKENHIRNLENIKVQPPHQYVTCQRLSCLFDLKWTRCQLMKAAELMTPELLDDFAARFIRKVHIEGLVFGNTTKDRASTLGDWIESKLPKDATPLLAQQLLLQRDVELEKGTSYLREFKISVSKLSSASVYYACGMRSARSNVALELLQQALKEPCFDTLRNKEQLAYSLQCDVKGTIGVQGLSFIVQSDRHPAYVDHRIEAFVASMQEYLENMPEEEFLNHRSALAARRLEQPKHLNAKAQILWNEITAQTYNFDRARVEVEQLNTIDKVELIEFYKKHISESSPERQKLAVHIVSTAEGAGAGQEQSETPNKDVKEPTLITDLVEFKSRCRLYPLPAPFVNVPRKGAQC